MEQSGIMVTGKNIDIKKLQKILEQMKIEAGILPKDMKANKKR